MKEYEVLFVTLTFSKGYVIYDPDGYDVIDNESAEFGKYKSLQAHESKPVIPDKETTTISDVIVYLAKQGYLYHGVADSSNRHHATIEPKILLVFYRLVEK